MRSLVLDSLDPACNLALEETLFTSLHSGQPGWFLLWRNGPSVIVGRHQNTLEEINEPFLRAHGLPVHRRLTGGGAVYHDAGNLNFSFLQPCAPGVPTDFAHFLRPVLEALRELGVPATCSGRNDILVGGRKVSGSAQWRNREAVLHHGTLLVSLDLDMLEAVLMGAPDKYTSKGIASVRARVGNLSDVLPAGCGMEAVGAALLRHCARGAGTLPDAVLARAKRLAETKYRSFAWNYGASPPFTERRRRRFPWGAVECCFDVRRGHIAGCRIYGDFFSQGDLGELEARLTGIPYTPTSLADALGTIPLETYFCGCDAVALRRFLVDGH